MPETINSEAIPAIKTINTRDVYGPVYDHVREEVEMSAQHLLPEERAQLLSEKLPLRDDLAGKVARSGAYKRLQYRVQDSERADAGTLIDLRQERLRREWQALEEQRRHLGAVAVHPNGTDQE